MRKILATVIKEWILLRRDVAGLLLLLIMPVMLIVVMALIEDAPFKDYQEYKFDLLLTDNDQGTLAKQIIDGLKHSKNFRIIDSVEGQPLQEAQLKAMLQKGEYKIGVVIPKGVTAEVVNSANMIVNDISKRIGMSATQAVRERRPGVFVKMYFDPVTKPTFRLAINNALDKYITYSCSNVLLQHLSVLNKDTVGQGNNSDLKEVMQGIGIKEESLNGNVKINKHINSVQHNVPAWAIFGMFFIVIPIAGNMIREREEGSAMRTALIPNANLYISMGKVLFNTIICMVQFFAMFCFGIWFMPLLGLDSLYLGAHPFALLPIAFCIGFAATTAGYFVGATFKTTNQALPFGAIAIVILSAIGGIWVPSDLLPPLMQKLSNVSPLHWSIEAVNNIIIRDGGVETAVKPMLFLILIGLVLWVSGNIINTRKVSA